METPLLFFLPGPWIWPLLTPEPTGQWLLGQCVLSPWPTTFTPCSLSHARSHSQQLCLPLFPFQRLSSLHNSQPHSVMSVLSKFHASFSLGPFTGSMTHVASWNSIHRIRHLRSGKIGLIIDAESKIYFKPNQINEARMKLLLGI